MATAESSPPNQQVKYLRARDNPFFDGMRRGEASVRTRSPLFAFLGKTRQKISRSTSDIGDRGSQKIFADVSKNENIHYNPSKDSPSENLAKTPETTFDPVEKTLSDSNDSKLEEVCGPLEISYRVIKRASNFNQIPLPQSAASFYNGNSPQMEVVESCDSINRLNLYLKARKEDIKAGVPGMFLHAVMGQDVSDVGSIVSTILYAFYLNETLKNNQFCIVPVINMKREDLNSHAELKWLLDSCTISESSLVFIDEIDLSYYDLYGSLKLVLLNGDKLPYKQEALRESVVDTFNCRKVSVAQDCSSCAIVAELFASTSPEILASKGFCRLLLAGILLDTGNLSDPHCTAKDMYMATLLINGAGRFGCNGLYQMLRFKMHDVSDLKVGEILRKDFRKWTRISNPDSSGPRLTDSHVGMASIGISVTQLLAHDVTPTHEIIHFQQVEKLQVLMIVSGYYDHQKNFKREILVSAESTELMTHLLQFFESHGSYIPLSDLHQPGSMRLSMRPHRKSHEPSVATCGKESAKSQSLGLRYGIRAFKIDEGITRRTIERVLEDFADTLRC